MTDSQLSREELVHAYLTGKMDEVQLSEFEIQILEDPSLLDDVQAQKLFIGELRNNAEQLEASGHADVVNHPNYSGQSNLALINWIRQPYSIAASIAMLVGAVFLSLPLEPERGDSVSRLVPISDVIDVGGTNRGATTTISAPLSESNRYYLRIDVGLAGANREYRASISSAQGSNRDSSLVADVVANDLGLIGLLYEGDGSGGLTLSLVRLADDGEILEMETMTISLE